MDCTICCEKFNKSKNKQINCGYCNYSFCKSCFQTYLLNCIEDPQCMNCKRTFNYDFLINSCTATFINSEYRDHRRNVLFDREKSLLIETQPYAIVEKQKRELENERNKLKKELRELEVLVSDKRYEIYKIENHLRKLNRETVEENEARKFIRKCPISNCRGFLSTRWICGMCDSAICNKCNELKQENHECNPENVASMEFLNKDTKPCPECGTFIHRISGCSQMYCTNCNTPWDWNSGKRVSGNIHNPHYYDFIRNGGGGNRDNQDIPCGGLPFVSELRTPINVNYDKYGYLFRVHNLVTHIQEVELPVYRVNNVVDFNRDLRVSYILNGIDEKDFKQMLLTREKLREKKLNYFNIFQMFINVLSDILRQIVVNYKQNINKLILFDKFVDEQKKIIDNLIIYFNENVKKVGNMYKCVYPGIHLYSFKKNIKTFNKENNLNN